jgi:hypothetical protein
VSASSVTRAMESATKNAEYDDLISGYDQHRGGIHVLLIILDGTIFIRELT